MIICPVCKEEIEDDSHYCDQCGQALYFCEQCGRVGVGRRCTYCGGLMLSSDSKKRAGLPTSSFGGYESTGSISNVTQLGSAGVVPVLTLSNDSLNIRIVGMNGAIIGRRQGPYVQFFANQGYVSGVHAQLKYDPKSGWCVVDKHSSNGTKLNQRQVQPDVDMTLKSGDILTLANVNLQVNIR